jgi:hypothetical protein
MKNIFRFAALLWTALFFPAVAVAQSSLFDQEPVPFTSLSNAELLCQSEAISGGSLYICALKAAGQYGPVLGMAQSFVPAAAGGMVRQLKLTDAKSDLGVPMTAAPGTPSGTVGVTRTAGSKLTLTGETTSGAAAVTDKALFEFDLPDSYVAGANIAVTVNCAAAGTDITAASTTMTAAAYTEINGVEAALGVTAAQQIPTTPTNLTFTITGTGLTPGAHVALDLIMLVTTTTGGAATGVINSVAYQG